GLASVEPGWIVRAAAVGEPPEPLDGKTERPVRSGIEVEVADGERRRRLAVVRVLEGGEARAAGRPALRLRLQRHLERDLDGGRSVVGQEDLAEVARKAPRRRGGAPGRRRQAVRRRQDSLAEAHQRRAG